MKEIPNTQSQITTKDQKSKSKVQTDSFVSIIRFWNLFGILI